MGTILDAMGRASGCSGTLTGTLEGDILDARGHAADCEHNWQALGLLGAQTPMGRAIQLLPLYCTKCASPHALVLNKVIDAAVAEYQVNG